MYVTLGKLASIIVRENYTENDYENNDGEDGGDGSHDDDGNNDTGSNDDNTDNVNNTISRISANVNMSFL